MNPLVFGWMIGTGIFLLTTSTVPVFTGVSLIALGVMALIMDCFGND